MEPKQGVEGEEVNTSPTVNPSVQTPEAEKTQGDGSQVQPVQNPDEFPTEVGKQREAFISMRKSLSEKDKELAEYRQRLEAQESDRGTALREQSVLETLRGSNIPRNLEPITPDTDLDTVSSRMTQAEREAYNARDEVMSLKKQLADEALFRVVPELNPDGENYKKPETKALEKYIASQLLMEGIQGKDINDAKTITRIAKRAKEEFEGFSNSKRDQIASETLENLKKTEQASLEARGNSVVQPKQVDLSSLKQRVYRGDSEATAELLKNTVLADW